MGSAIAFAHRDCAVCQPLVLEKRSLFIGEQFESWPPSVWVYLNRCDRWLAQKEGIYNRLLDAFPDL